MVLDGTIPCTRPRFWQSLGNAEARRMTFESMVLQGTPRYSRVLHGTPRYSKVLQGTPIQSANAYASVRNPLGVKLEEKRCAVACALDLHKPTLQSSGPLRRMCELVNPRLLAHPCWSNFHPRPHPPTHPPYSPTHHKLTQQPIRTRPGAHTRARGFCAHQWVRVRMWCVHVCACGHVCVCVRACMRMRACAGAIQSASS